MLSELRPGDDDGTVLVLKGTVGDGAANEFLAFQRELDLPDPLDVIAHPNRYDWSGMRPDKAFATVNAVRAYVLGTTPDKTLWLGAVNALSTARRRVCPTSPKVRSQHCSPTCRTGWVYLAGSATRSPSCLSASAAGPHDRAPQQHWFGQSTARLLAQQDAVAQSLATPQMANWRAVLILCSVAALIRHRRPMVLTPGCRA